jgi:hypothetical protein
MSKIMILYRLKADVTREQYESWTRNTDYPTMRGLQRVESFVNHRAIRHLLTRRSPASITLKYSMFQTWRDF